MRCNNDTIFVICVLGRERCRLVMHVGGLFFSPQMPSLSPGAYQNAKTAARMRNGKQSFDLIDCHYCTLLYKQPHFTRLFRISTSSSYYGQDSKRKPNSLDWQFFKPQHCLRESSRLEKECAHTTISISCRQAEKSTITTCLLQMAAHREA